MASIKDAIKSWEAKEAKRAADAGPSAHLIARSDIKYDDSAKPLGNGGFGVVFKGTRTGGSQVAVKRLLPGMTAQSRLAFQKEVDIMCRMRSEFVVPVYGVVDDSPDQPVLLIMKLMHESLHSAYSSVPPPSLWQRIKWLVQASKGIEFLHGQSVLHRDLKPANMLISSPETGRCLELGDFGLSKHLADITSSSLRSMNPSAAVPSSAAGGVGTPHYMAPEIISFPPTYSSKSDVYAFGVVMREVICMKMPFEGCNDTHELRKAIKKRGYREPFPQDFPPTMQVLIERAWHQEPGMRPAIGEIVTELEQFLKQLPPDVKATGAKGSHGSALAPSTATMPATAPSTSRMPAAATLDSRVPKAVALPHLARDNTQPPASLKVDVSQLSSLQPSDICILIHAAGPDFIAKGYGTAAEKKKLKGDFIVKANDIELSTLFAQMGVDAVDMPALREAVSSWKANPALAFQTLDDARERARAAAAAEAAERQRQAEAQRQWEAEEQKRRQEVESNHQCPHCYGDGYIDGDECSYCDGTGRKNECPDCDGHGYNYGEQCSKCYGSGRRDSGDRCYDCNGTGFYDGVGGSDECSNCNGTGFSDDNRCVNCNGTGFYYDGVGGDDECSNCNGTGRV